MGFELLKVDGSVAIFVNFLEQLVDIIPSRLCDLFAASEFKTRLATVEAEGFLEILKRDCPILVFVENFECLL